MGKSHYRKPLTVSLVISKAYTVNGLNTEQKYYLKHSEKFIIVVKLGESSESSKIRSTNL